VGDAKALQILAEHWEEEGLSPEDAQIVTRALFRMVDDARQAATDVQNRHEAVQ
jgi:hypothetical protein